MTTAHVTTSKDGELYLLTVERANVREVFDFGSEKERNKARGSAIKMFRRAGVKILCTPKELS